MTLNQVHTDVVLLSYRVGNKLKRMNMNMLILWPSSSRQIEWQANFIETSLIVKSGVALLLMAIYIYPHMSYLTDKGMF